MTPRHLLVEADGEITYYSTMKAAALAFGKALTTHSDVKLVERLLDGDNVIAQHIDRASAAGSAAVRHCPVCGKPWCHGHGFDTTAQRILMQHEYQNHSQCHPGAACKRKESEASASG